jgi:transcriptional regulator with XRE-family HTH domain
MTVDLTVKRFRKENLLSLLGQYSRREICERTGITSSQISQLAAGRQELDNADARQFEKSMGLPVGWMDRAHSTVDLQIEKGSEALPLEERVLLTKFRQLNSTAQVHVRAVIDAFLVAQRGKNS